MTLSGCYVGFTPEFSKEDIAEVELVKIDHPYLRKVIDRKALDENLFGSFYNDLRSANAMGPIKVFTCFELHVKTKDGQTASFRTNGHMFSRLSNDKFYLFDGQENLISKYWKINVDCP